MTSNLVVPSSSLPSLAQEVLAFSSNLRPWLETSMKGLPDTLKETKYKGMHICIYMYN